MPSFDLVSKIDSGELKNVVSMAQKQIAGRYDFKGSNTSLEFKGEDALEIIAEDEYKVGAALEILRLNMGKRGIGMKALEPGDVEPSGNRQYKQVLKIKSGIEKELGKKINKIVKESGLKVTSALIDDKIRLTAKQIDDLQAAFQMLRNHKDVDTELQMENMKR
jgi:uncharacterized protein YajQ (UPF0234 family)